MAVAYEDGIVAIKGWAIDPDTTRPVYLWVSVGSEGEYVLADDPRPDVGAAYPAYGANHGFYAETELDNGWHSICVTISNVGRGIHKPLWCLPVTVFLPGSPVGEWEKLRAGVNVVELAGWAIDPDSTGPVTVRLATSGTRRFLADVPRPDVGEAFPDYGADHGFAVRLRSGPGEFYACLGFDGIGLTGDDTFMGCRSVTVPSIPSPIGNFERASAVPGGIEVKGWTIDPQEPNPIYVWVTVDGVGRHLRADRNRPDVRDNLPAFDARAGFLGTVPAARGTHTVCVTASNVGPGSHTSLGCRRVAVTS